ncbi:MAG: hypothetical protein IKZ02_02285, partial [Alphaproteobacteria bacterium]|nr:hypothetical protein [Alphaproteobacteria bacterium]
GTIEANSVSGTSESKAGINNYGTIEANSVSGTSESKAGINNYGTIEANNVSGTSKSEVGIDNYDTIDANSVSGISESKAGIDNYGTIEANNVSGTSENGNGIENTHIIKGQNIYYCKTINNTGQIIGSISCNCVDNTQCAGTMPTVCTVPTPVLYSSNQCYSCEDSFLFKPYWNAENGSCQSCIDKNEATPYWNAETDECTVCPDDKPYWSGSACESACPLEKPIYNANKICSSCPVETPYWNGNTCVESCPNDNPVHGNICDIDETSCSYLMSQAGYTDFTVTGNTITYNGEMEISSDLDISVCNLNINGTLYVKSDKTTLKANNIIIKNTFGIYGVRNAGTITANKIIAENLLGAYGIWNDGTITATEIKGVSRSGRGINNANSSVIKANAVIGISTDGTGTDNWGTIEANTVTGNSETSHGLSNWGAIDATTVTGNSETRWGLTNYNTITATTVTGSSLGSQPAISNFEEAVITAENVYYCKKISNTGKITGTISCNCADSTQCSGTAPTQCTAPTPVLSGDLTTCISCETADSTKPYYDGKMCVATCPTETPMSDANNICKTCAEVDGTKPYWSGTECVSCATIDSTTPVWDSENQTCIACAEGTEWNGESCVKIDCPNSTPVWNGMECVSCATFDSTKPYWDAENKVCVSTCSSGKRDGYICVTNCPIDRPFVSDGVCVAECSGAKPYRNGVTCVSACPSDKPSLDADNACRSCPARAPIWDGSACVSCASIDPDKPYWWESWSGEKTNACISEDQLCSEAILDMNGIGIDDTEYYSYDADTNTLTINSKNYQDVWVSGDFSSCNLVVNNRSVTLGNIEINSLTVNNPEGEYGVKLYENERATIYGDLVGTGKHYGIINEGYELDVGGKIVGTATDTTGSISDSFAGGGIPNAGVMNFLDGTISATTITGINHSADGYGIVNSYYYEVGTITANIISYCQNIENAGTIVGQIRCDCSGTELTCAENPTTTCYGDTPISVIISEYDPDVEEYVPTEECISCAEFNSSTPYWDDDAQMCTVCPPDKPYIYKEQIYNPPFTIIGEATCTATCPSGTTAIRNECVTVEESECAQAMVDAGFITGYDVDGTTINYSGNMNVNNDLYIPSCDLNVEGTLNIDATVVVNNLT